MGTKAIQIVDLDCAALLVDLNKAYADEWLTAYAYNYMGQVVSGRPAAEQLAGLLLDTSKDELKHQQELAGRIISLGGKPPADFTRLAEASSSGYPFPPGDERDFEAAVKTVIQAEHDAIEFYDQLLRKVRGKDPITYNLILLILMEEVEHEDEFEMLVE